MGLPPPHRPPPAPAQPTRRVMTRPRHPILPRRTRSPSRQPEPERVEVPTLVGMTRAEAEQIVADLGLEATTKYRSTDQYPAEIVISQSHKAGAWVLPDTTISLVVAKTPPAPPPPPPAPSRRHHRRARRRTAIRPIPTCALTPRSRTMTVRAGQATDPSTLRARSACSHPTRSIWTGRRRLGLRERVTAARRPATGITKDPVEGLISGRLSTSWNGAQMNLLTQRSRVQIPPRHQAHQGLRPSPPSWEWGALPVLAAGLAGHADFPPRPVLSDAGGAGTAADGRDAVIVIAAKFQVIVGDVTVPGRR